MTDNYNDSDALEQKEDDIITLRSADGEDIEFVEIAGIAYNGAFYNILQPVELIEGMSEDEALVFKREEKGDGEIAYSIVLDDDIIDAVFEIYDQLLDEHMRKQEENS